MLKNHSMQYNIVNAAFINLKQVIIFAVQAQSFTEEIIPRAPHVAILR